ncbi:MAG: hypothetical protein AB1529_07985 [Candidatus Micrarchaeota archaeon]
MNGLLSPTMMAEVCVVCIDTPLGEWEKPLGLDSSLEHDAVVKRISGTIYGSNVSKDRIHEMMRAIIKALPLKTGTKGQKNGG